MVQDEQTTADLLQRIIFENDALIAIDKPAGWLSVPSRFGIKDSRPCVGTLLQQTIKKRLWPVHRLDFEVSGILIFAIHAKAHRQLCSLFENRSVIKTYEAWTLGPHHLGGVASEKPSPSQFLPELNKTYIWNSCLVRGKKRTFEAPHGQQATTMSLWEETVQVCSKQMTSLELSRWRLNPHTGRPHQLRYEMFKHGIPIIGDTLYGGAPLLKPKDMIALECTMLEFSKVDCSMPSDIPSIIKTKKSFIDHIQDEIL